jgi:aminoglycoside phosphotransferase (APT) family kinase protein
MDGRDVRAQSTVNHRDARSDEPMDAEAIPRRLGDYLGTPPCNLRVLASGWETTVFEFALAASSPCVRELPVNQPLVLRCYQGSRAEDKGSREAAAMLMLAQAGYPVPRPYRFEPDRQPLGMPFLLMGRAHGVPLFSTRSFPQAFKIFSLGFISFVRVQAQLHGLASSGKLVLKDFLQAFVSAQACSRLPLIERIFQVIAGRIEQGPLPGLHDALLSLRDRAARFKPAADAPLHMDYHPQNVLVNNFCVTGVIDWVNADHGDRYLCAATTAVILSTTAMEHPRWMGENSAGHVLRGLFAGLYLPIYHALAPMELERFRFAQGVAALLRLSMFGMMRTRGAESMGFRPEAIENVTPPVVRLLSRYASKKTGVPVKI